MFGFAMVITIAEIILTKWSLVPPEPVPKINFDVQEADAFL